MDVAIDPMHFSAIANSPANSSASLPSGIDRSLKSHIRLRARHDIQWTQVRPAYGRVRPACPVGQETALDVSPPTPSTAQRSSRSLWIAFDPITRRSFRFGDEERWIIERLDGRQTLASVQQQFAQQFQPLEISRQSLEDLCAGMMQNGLVQQVGTQCTHENSTTSGLSITNFIVWRIRGIDADALLARLAPHSNWLFSAQAVRFWLAFATLALTAVLLEFPRLTTQATSWNWLIQPTNWGMMMVVFLITRGLHELGHALACKRFGVRCPDIGLLMILGAPCVYCDVSESWKLPSLWQRAAIAAAGMYVELIVAACAAMVWIATVDGNANTIALQTMFVCSISTLAINANPLLRFDGYYILSDIVDEPNLRVRADHAAWRLLLGLVLGPRATGNMTLTQSAARRRLLIGFSLAGWLYRLSLSLAMTAIIIALYDSWHLIWFGRILAASLMISWWILPMLRIAKSLWTIASRIGGRMRLSLLTAALVVAIGLLPFPYRQFSSGWVQPKEMFGVYAPSSAQLVRISAKDGQRVEAQTTLFELRDHQLQLVAQSQAGQFKRAQLELISRRRDRYYQDTVANDLSALEAAAESAQQQAEHAARCVDRLSIKSPINGTFMAMPAAPPEDAGTFQPATFPRQWVDENQLGRRVPKGTMLGAVCSNQHIAVIPLNDNQLAWIHAGTEVRLRPSSSSMEVLRCTVQAVVQLQEIDTSWRLISASSVTSGIPTNSSTTGRTAAQTSNQVSIGGYAAIVELPENLHPLPGTRIDAAFIAESQTLVQLAQRWSQENLRWLAD